MNEQNLRSRADSPLRVRRPLAVALILLAAVIAPLSVMAEGDTPSGQAPVPTALETLTVEARHAAPAYVAEGFIEARYEATLAAQLTGRVVEMRVDAGDRVKRGDALVRIDSSEYDQSVAAAEAGVAQAAANLANARANHARTLSLRQEGFLSPASLDQSEAALRAAEAAFRAAQAGEEQAVTVRAFTNVVSPLSGIIAARHVQQGETAQPGTPLVTVFDPDSLRAVASLPQSRAAALQATELTAQVALPESGRWVDATAVAILPSADPRSHTVLARVDLPAGLAGIAPGMAARIHFIAPGETRRLTVPVSTVLRRGEVSGVYLVDKDGRLTLRQVRIGEALSTDEVEILAGLSGGETIARDAIRAGIALRAERAAR